MRLVFCFVLSVIIGCATAGGYFECKVDHDCAATTATCVDNICKCPIAQVLNYDGTKCLPYTRVILDECEVDSQCDIFGGAIACIDEKCKCKDGYVYLKGHCIRRLKNHEACTTNDQCFDGMDYNSRVCKDSKCQCAEGYDDSRDAIDCRRKIALGAACVMTLDCQDVGAVCKDDKCIIEEMNQIEKEEVTLVQVPDDENLDYTMTVVPEEEEACKPGDACSDPNAICSSFTQTCICRNGFFESKKKCIKELGMPCTNKDECPSDCENNICNCPINQHFGESNQKCRKTAPQVGYILKCAKDDSCRVLINHYVCVSEGLQKFCGCNNGYTINDKFICVEGCSKDKDCKEPHQICDPKFNKCVCPPEYKEVAGHCEPRIDGVCKKNEDCVEQNAQCTINKCVCKEEYVNYEHSCYPEIPIDGECMYNEQCAWKYNTTCVKSGSSENKSCKCEPGFIKVNDNCYRVATRVGDYCTHPKVCMAGSICENSKCTCSSGMVPSKDRIRCTEKTSNAVDRLAASAATLLGLSVIAVAVCT